MHDVELTRAVHHGVLVLLQEQHPARQLTRRRLVALQQPYKRAVVNRDEARTGGQGRRAKLVEAVHYREALELRHEVVAFSLGRKLVDDGHWHDRWAGRGRGRLSRGHA